MKTSIHDAWNKKVFEKLSKECPEFGSLAETLIFCMIEDNIEIDEYFDLLEFSNLIKVDDFETTFVGYYTVDKGMYKMTEEFWNLFI